MWKSGSGRSLIRDGNAICMVMETRGENCTPGFERSSSFREPIFRRSRHFSKLPYRQLCLASNRIETNSKISTFFSPRRTRFWPLLFAVNKFFVSFFSPPPFVTKQLRSRLNWIHRWWRDWNWNNTNTTRIPLIPLGGNQKMESLETKYGSVLLSRIIDEREKKKEHPERICWRGEGGCSME